MADRKFSPEVVAFAAYLWRRNVALPEIIESIQDTFRIEVSVQSLQYQVTAKPEKFPPRHPDFRAMAISRKKTKSEEYREEVKALVKKWQGARHTDELNGAKKPKQKEKKPATKERPAGNPSDLTW